MDAGMWTHLARWTSLPERRGSAAGEWVPRMSPETTDEEKRGRPLSAWFREAACFPSSSVVSGDIRGPYPAFVLRVLGLIGKLGAGLSLNDPAG